METAPPKPRSTRSYLRLMAARRRASERRATSADVRLLARYQPCMSLGGAHEGDVEVEYSVRIRRKMLPVEEVRSLVCAPAAAQHGRACGSAPTRRRGSRRTTSTRAGPDDDEGSEPEPEQSDERLCLGCSASIAHKAKQARFCSRRCAKACERSDARLVADRPTVIGPVEPASIVRPGGFDWNFDAEFEMSTDADGIYLGPVGNRIAPATLEQKIDRARLGRRRSKERQRASTTVVDRAMYRKRAKTWTGFARMGVAA